MGVHEDLAYPWLWEEKSFIRESIDAGKIVLGICLGAQLIADVMGAKVTKNEHREIGWFPVDRKIDGSESPLADAFPERLDVFHCKTVPQG